MNVNLMKKTCMAVLAVWCAVAAQAEDTFASWAMDVRGLRLGGKSEGSWQTGKLAGIAKTYEARMKANAADYEARILHAASIVAQLGENKNVSAYAKKFGCTLDYLGMKATVSQTAPTSWPAVNTMVDAFVSEAVPVLKTALADLEGIPSDWTGSVRLSADEYPVDEDVNLDIGDVLYARAGIEATIGLAYYAQSYDLTTDWTKAKAAWDYQLTVPLSTTTPSMELGDDEGWRDAIGGRRFRIKMAGTKLYIKAFFSCEREVNADEMNVVLDGEIEFENIKTGANLAVVFQRDYDYKTGEYGELYALIGSWENLEAYWRAWESDEARAAALRKLTRAGVEYHVSGDGVETVLSIDLMGAQNLLTARTWSINWGELDAMFEKDGEYSEYDDIDLDIDGGPDFFQKFLTEQTQFMAKLRNAQLLPVSKNWMATAFNRVLQADQAVQNRTDDVMHFVEYDPLDAADVERGRALTQKALAALDAPQAVDVREDVLGAREPNFDVSLLPNDGLMQVYLGALFEGQVTRDLLPTLEKGLNEGPVPVLETIKDPTLGGLLPDFSVYTWENLLPEFAIEVTHQKMTVKLDANGGKVTPSGIVVMATDVYGELPEPTLNNAAFDGWWTAKDGGVQVREGDAVDFSVFANAKTPTLYAQWRLAHKITVTGGVLIDDEGEEKTALSGLYRGEEVSAYIDRSKLYDKNQNEVNAFANWTYTPATADLGEGFDPLSPEVTVSMPNADVKLTANFVNGFAGFLHCQCYTEGTDAQGNEPIGDFYWSIDNGKTLFPFGESGYPVKSGKVTVKFYDKTGKWRAADQTFTFNKRGTYKEDGVTRYSDPETFFSFAKFVPVDNSTKVKIDANGGMGSGDVFFANGWEYGWLGIPYRKGYVFAGWWTTKDGGEHITQDMVFDPTAFAGQKTPTIYAHWLQLKKLTMKDDSAHAYWDLEDANFDPELLDEITQSLSMGSGFEGYGELEGKGVLEVLPGARVSVSVDGYSYDKNDNELVFQRWMVTPSKVDMGADFKATQPEDVMFAMPDSDVTLQASYIDESTAGTLYGELQYETILLGYDDTTGDPIYLKPSAGSLEWSVDGGKNWYKATMTDVSAYADDDSTFDGDYAMLKYGKYTVTWRSNDPQWAVPAATKAVVYVDAGGRHDVSAPIMSFTPQVVVDLVAYDRMEGVYVAAPTAGSVTLNPKDGLVPAGKMVTLTAKAAKDYAFQGWGFAKNFDDGYSDFTETSAAWKLENYANYCCGMSTPSTYLTRYIDPVDKKVHVVAAFKALKDYSADDIVFEGFYSYYRESRIDATYDDKGNASVTIKAVAGCVIDSESDGYLELCCGADAFPLTWKLNGKLPDGLKFDAKTGCLSGAPKKPGNTTVTITATDPAKNAKNLTVNFIVNPLPDWLVGEFRGIMSEEKWVPGYSYWDDEAQEDVWVEGYNLPGQQNGILELSVKSDGKVSAKLLTSVGSRSVSGTLSWFPDEDESDGDGYYHFFAKETKDEEECDVEFYPDGTIEGYADSYSKSGGYVGGDMVGMRQDTKLLEQSPFLDKYYTFAFCAETTGDEESKMKSGYGYLTLKTDKKGVAKVTGLLPDGEKVSMSALVLPFVDDESEALKARLYVFASPSSYKKHDWFAMAPTLAPDGTVTSGENAAWTPANGDDEGELGQAPLAHVSGFGALYSEAKSLEAYYWTVSCEWNENVRQQYSYKEYYEDDNGKPAYETTYEYADAQNFFDGVFFNVAVKGDKKGAISLAEKSPAPWEMSWKEEGVTRKEWNYEKDKKNNPITDPSQLSISFTKATGIFTGKANAYFDYWQPDYKKDRSGGYYDAGSQKHVAASLPYSGVIVYDRDRAENGQNPYVGFGSAVHTYKYSYSEYSGGKAKTDTKKVTLPVSLMPASVEP